MIEVTLSEVHMLQNLEIEGIIEWLVDVELHSRVRIVRSSTPGLDVEVVAVVIIQQILGNVANTEEPQPVGLHSSIKALHICVFEHVTFVSDDLHGAVDPVVVWHLAIWQRPHRVQAGSQHVERH